MDYTVLFVDDEQDLNEICCEIFELEGFNVISAACAEEALGLLEVHTVDVVISDARMPNMSGFQLLDHIQDMGKSPLFYLSTGVVDVNESDFVAKGGTGVVLKPYNVDELIDRVRIDLKNL